MNDSLECPVSPREQSTKTSQGGNIIFNGENGYRYLGSLHILYQQQPTELDRHIIQIRHWLAAEGEYSDLIVEQGLLQNEDLQTDSFVMPFHYSTDQALESVISQKGQ